MVDVASSDDDKTRVSSNKMDLSSDRSKSSKSLQSGEETSQSSVAFVSIGKWPKADLDSSQFDTDMDNIVNQINAVGRGKSRYSKAQSARQSVIDRELRTENKGIKTQGYTRSQQANSNPKSNTLQKQMQRRTKADKTSQSLK